MAAPAGLRASMNMIPMATAVNPPASKPGDQMSHPPDPAALAAGVAWFHGWKWAGNFTALDLLAAGTNALNGALLARRPDHYKNFTIVGVILMALLMGLGGG